jgi:hypothetical protein
LAHFLPSLPGMVFYIQVEILSYIQGFLSHLLMNEPVLLFFQPLSFPGLEVSDGLMQIVKQAFGKQTKNEEHGYQRDESRHDTEVENPGVEALKKRMF